METNPNTKSETDLADFDAGLESSGRVELILRWSKGIEVKSLAEGEALTFGRASEASLPIPDSRVSRLHARISVESGAVWVEDLGSRNGTFVGHHHLVGEKRRAVAGDLVRIGPLDIVVAVLGLHPTEDRPEIIIADTSMRRVMDVVARLAATQTTVLITGETGSGKEVVAEQIHRLGARRDGPFVRLDCASVTPSAWLSADLSGGTVLFDEVAELPPEMQAKLLSFLEHRQIDQVRVLCATQRDLEKDVADGKFRRDLFYRINTFMLHVPPLRERPEEILLLADHYAKALSRSLDMPAPTLDASACSSLIAHRWPGNVRELKNAIEHAMVLASAGVVSKEHLPESVTGRKVDSDQAGNLFDRLSDVEKKSIETALKLERGNQTKAARRLGITRRALIYRLDRLGLRKS